MNLSITTPMKIADFKKTVPDFLKFVKKTISLSNKKIDAGYIECTMDNEENYVVFLKKYNTILCVACFNFYEKTNYLYLDILCSEKGYGKYMIFNLFNICVSMELYGIMLDAGTESEKFYKKHGFFTNVQEDCDFNPDEIFSEKKRFKKCEEEEEEKTPEMVLYVMNKVPVSVYPFVNGG